MYVPDAYASLNIPMPSTDGCGQLRLVQDLHGTAHNWRSCQGAAEDLKLRSRCPGFLIVWWLHREGGLAEQRQRPCLINDCDGWICAVDSRVIVYTNECPSLLLVLSLASWYLVEDKSAPRPVI